MPINIVDQPAAPQCGGQQWSVADEKELSALVARVLVGRARQVAAILEGAEDGPVVTLAATKARLKRELVLEPDTDPWHRDGLLFETICWIVARKNAAPNEVLSDPHRRSTQQGADTVKVLFDNDERELVRATVYEQKCSDRPRDKFRGEVLPAFKQWLEGVRDDELLQIAIALLDRFNLTDAERQRAFGRLILQRPLALRAALTVSPDSFPGSECIKLFKDFDSLSIEVTERFGDTFPLGDIRAWFAAFALMVWSEIETFDV